METFHLVPSRARLVTGIHLEPQVAISLAIYESERQSGSRSMQPDTTHSQCLYGFFYRYGSIHISSEQCFVLFS